MSVLAKFRDYNKQRKQMAPKNLGERWRELNGKNNWEGLLDPLDPDLRQHIINYGELTQAVYDAFNDDEASRFTGAPRYARRDFFEKVFLKAGRAYSYKVTKFVYATAGIDLPGGIILRSLTKDWKLKESNWMGYVAVATDEGKTALGRRDILVAWRGTVRPLEWVNDIEFALVPAGDIVGSSSRAEPDDGNGGGDHEPMVYAGWKSVYTTENPKSPFSKTCARDQCRSPFQATFPTTPTEVTKEGEIASGQNIKVVRVHLLMDMDAAYSITFKFGGYWYDVKGQNRKKYEGGNQKTIKILKDIISYSVLREETQVIYPWLVG